MASNPSSDHRLICYRWGNPQAEQAVLCVHGLTRNGRDFDWLAARLAQDFQVLCPDMPGRGESPWLADPSTYTNAAYLTDIMFLLTTLDIKRVHWVGTSMGGILGMMAAQAYSDSIASLVLNDIGCFIPAAGLERIRDAAQLKTFFTDRNEAETAYRKRCATFGITDEAIWTHLFAHGIKSVDGGFHFTYDPAILTTGFPPEKLMADIDLWPLWDKVKPHPVLLIHGEQSDILPLRVAEEMKASHPNATLATVAAAGHAPMLMDNKQMALIQDWIKRHAK